MAQKLPDSFISCDWGTSRLRLRYVEVPSMTVRGEAISDQGISKTFEMWEKDGEPGGRIDFFAGILRKELQGLKDFAPNLSSAELPIICSGMASSSLGIETVPYARLPYALDGSRATVSKVTSGILPNPLFLIGGIQGRDDVMRGEETELLGIASLINSLPDNFLAILPGTHSKHIQVTKGRITGFDTFMTGELFMMLREHGTLSHSLKIRDRPHWESFEKGAMLALDKPLLNALFRVRVNDLLGTLTKEQNYDFLSGLLIGTEVSHLKERAGIHLVLMGGTAHLDYYKRAVAFLGLNEQLNCIGGPLSDLAAIHGQWLIYQKFVQE